MNLGGEYNNYSSQPTHINPIEIKDLFIFVEQNTLVISFIQKERKKLHFVYVERIQEKCFTTSIPETKKTSIHCRETKRLQGDCRGPPKTLAKHKRTRPKPTIQKNREQS